MLLTNAKKRTDRLRITSVGRYIRCDSEELKPFKLGMSPEIIAERGETPRFIVQPLCGADTIDVTQKVIEAIAHELWHARGGNDLLNWLEAERMFAQTMRALNGESCSASPRRSRAAGLRHRSQRMRVRGNRGGAATLAKSARDEAQPAR